MPHKDEHPTSEEENQPVDPEINPDPSAEESDLESDSNEEQAGNDEWYEQQEFVADPKQSLIRLDKFLMDRLSNRSRSKVQNAIRAGSVKVDNHSVKPNYKVKPGNHVSIVLPKSMEDANRIAPQDIPLDVIYEDDEVMVINKPAKMAVHPGVGIPNGTLVNAVAFHLKEQFEKLPVKEGNEGDRAGIVHRIDKDTTGLMVIAKKDYAMVHLANQFFHHTIERKYWALVWGDLEGDSGTVVGNIGRNPNDRKLFMVFPEGEDGKHAITHWRVLERFYYVTLIECQLETGRTHQIRVHMKSIGHTLFGDPRYGGNQILKGTLYAKYKQFAEGLLNILPRQALHARVLGFIHPGTGEHMRFEADLPQDMQTVIDKWRIYVQSRKDLL
ncbi:MAG: RluA family pseudouridine synthase [Bacteroidetes bacterium]|nr:MAG: RluA family pseudouridine synthase [Bacteroidota bacterium]